MKVFQNRAVAAVLMVLASELYDESDYIRDYDEFLDYVKNCGDTTGEV